MVNILFIENDPRIDLLIDRLRLAVKGPIDAATDFDQGLREVFEKRPAIIFLQSEISGVSSLAVASHIKSLLREGSPHIFLLKDNLPGKVYAGRDFFDDLIDISAGTEELFNDVVAHLKAFKQIQWREEETPQPLPSEESLFIPVHEELELPSLGEGDTFGGVMEASYADVEPEAPPFPFVSSPATPVSAPAESVPEEKGLPIASETDLVQPIPESVQKSAPPAEVVLPRVEREKQWVDSANAVEIPPFDQVFSLRKETKQSSSRLLIVGLITAAVLAGGAYFFFIPAMTAEKSAGVSTKTSSSAVSPASDSAPQVQGPLQIALPPAFVSAQPVPPDKSMKPGWEKRTGEGFSLLLFREEGKLKAIQFISVMPGGFSPEQVDAALSMAGGGAVTWERQGEKDKVIVDYALLASKAEVLRYTRVGTSGPAALVVALP